MARWLIPLALLVLAGAVYWGIKRAGESRGSREAFPDSAETAAYLTGLREELAKRGIKLAIIAGLALAGWLAEGRRGRGA